jgi:ketosteroid isomerase-like protein
MDSVENQIRAMVTRETQAWDSGDAEALVALFHPDMIWIWPKDAHAHDPIDWEFPLGRFDRTRWLAFYQDFFARHALLHNRREIVRIAISEQGDGAFAVVDIDTLWRSIDGEEMHWKGRTCKGYTLLVGGQWKLIFHTGVLDYS